MTEEKLSSKFQGQSADPSELRMKNLMQRVCDNSQIGAEILSAATARGCKYVFRTNWEAVWGLIFGTKS